MCKYPTRDPCGSSSVLPAGSKEGADVCIFEQTPLKLSQISEESHTPLLGVYVFSEAINATEDRSGATVPLKQPPPGAPPRNGGHSGPKTRQGVVVCRE